MPKKKKSSSASSKFGAFGTDSRPTKIDEAAGGVVLGVRERVPHVVLIRTDRDGIARWSLPKGHFKNQETAEEAALREVREETGLDVEVRAPIGTIDYWFTEGKFKYHKFVHYFAMRSVGGRLDDHDDEVLEARWFPMDAALAVMAYETERTIVSEARTRFELSPDDES